MVLDWIVPSAQGDDAPLSAAATNDAVQRLQARHAGERLLLVTHGGVIRLLLARAQTVDRSGGLLLAGLALTLAGTAVMFARLPRRQPVTAGAPADLTA